MRKDYPESESEAGSQTQGREFVPSRIHVRGFARVGCPVDDKLSIDEAMEQAGLILDVLPTHVRRGLRQVYPFGFKWQISFHAS